MEVFVRPGIHLFIGPNTNVRQWLIPHARVVRNIQCSKRYLSVINDITIAQNHDFMFRTIGLPSNQIRTLAFEFHLSSGTENNIIRPMTTLLDKISCLLEKNTRILIAIPTANDLFHVEFHIQTCGLSSIFINSPEENWLVNEPNINFESLKNIHHTVWHCDRNGCVYDYTLHDFDLTQAARLIEFAHRQTNEELAISIMNHDDWGTRQLCTFISPERMAIDFLQRFRFNRKKWQKWIREWIIFSRFVRRASDRAKWLYLRSLKPGGRLYNVAKQRFELNKAKYLL